MELFVIITGIVASAALSFVVSRHFRKALEATEARILVAIAGRGSETDLGIVDEGVHTRNFLGRAIAALEARVDKPTAEIKKHISSELRANFLPIAEHAKEAATKALDDLRHATLATCETCNKQTISWHVFNGRPECSDCKIRRNG